MCESVVHGAGDRKWVSKRVSWYRLWAMLEKVSVWCTYVCVCASVVRGAGDRKWVSKRVSWCRVWAMLEKVSVWCTYVCVCICCAWGWR